MLLLYICVCVCLPILDIDLFIAVLLKLSAFIGFYQVDFWYWFISLINSQISTSGNWYKTQTDPQERVFMLQTNPTKVQLDPDWVHLFWLDQNKVGIK